MLEKNTKSEIPVPYWEHKYIFSVEDLKLANPEQKEFYEYFKRNFLNEKYIDVEGNTNYPFILLFDLIGKYEKHKDSDKLQKQMEILRNYYAETNRYVGIRIIELLENERNHHAVWELKKTGPNSVGFDEVYIYQKRLKKNLMDGEMILRLAATTALSDYDPTNSFLTPFGKKNIKSIQVIAEKYLKEFENSTGKQFFNNFFKRTVSVKGELIFYSSYNTLSGKKHTELYDREFYKQFFVDEKDFKEYKYKNDRYFVFRAMRNQLWKILEKAEINYCQSIILQDGNLLRSNDTDFKSVFSITEADSIDLINFINKFLGDLSSTEREILLGKFGGLPDEKVLSLEAIGLSHNITKEQVSSIATKATKSLRKLLEDTCDIISKKIYDSCFESVCPLTPQFLIYLTKNDYKLFLYPPAFYIRLIGKLSSEIPILPEYENKITSLDEDATKMSKQIKIYLKEFYIPVSLTDVFNRVASLTSEEKDSAKFFFEAIQSVKFNLIKTNNPKEVFIELREKEKS